MAWKFTVVIAILVVNYQTKISWLLEEVTAVRKQILPTVKRNSKRYMPLLVIRPRMKGFRTLSNVWNRAWLPEVTWGISMWTTSAKNKTIWRIHLEFTNHRLVMSIIRLQVSRIRANITQRHPRLHVPPEFRNSLRMLQESLTSLNAQTTFTHNKHIWIMKLRNLNLLTKLPMVKMILTWCRFPSQI